MNGKENAIKKIRLMRKEAEKTHETKIEELRKNSSFDELYRKINSLKWDFIRERNAEKREQIEKVLIGEGTVEEKLVKLIRKANNRGGTDNISVAYVDFREGDE